jgi:hypothetical protein
VRELFRLRNRVHYLETDLLATKMRAGPSLAAYFGGGIGGPNEMPEGEGGGTGGGGIHWPPGEIQEIAELPVSRLVTEVSSLGTRLNQLEANLGQQLRAITQRLDTLKK